VADDEKRKDETLKNSEMEVEYASVLAFFQVLW